MGQESIILNKDSQVSIGCAASPIRTSRSLCHEGIGSLATNFQNRTSLAFLNYWSDIVQHALLIQRKSHLTTDCNAGPKSLVA